jgi:hypothetical protein
MSDADLVLVSARLPRDTAKKLKVSAAEEETRLQDALLEAVLLWLDRPRSKGGARGSGGR